LQECTKLTSDNTVLDSEVKKLSADKEKDAADRSRLELENASAGEEKKKLLLTLQTAKQRLVALRTDKESLESSCAELRRQLDAATAERESTRQPVSQPSTGLTVTVLLVACFTCTTARDHRCFQKKWLGVGL